ncbi:MAG: hypothetical protein PHU71_05355 [Candidatus Gracilibacteria bacterium]|nr:hypothetical protein [Candidatus Gracilibacteria bacterium]
MRLSRTRIQEVLLIILGIFLMFSIAYVGTHDTGFIDGQENHAASSLLNAISEYQVRHDGQLPGEITSKEKEICAELENKQLCDSAGLLFMGKIREILASLPVNQAYQKPRTGYFVLVQNGLFTVKTVNKEGREIKVTRPSLQ